MDGEAICVRTEFYLLDDHPPVLTVYGRFNENLLNLFVTLYLETFEPLYAQIRQELQCIAKPFS